MLAIRIVTNVEILDCTGRTQSQYEERSAPDKGLNPVRRLTRHMFFYLFRPAPFDSANPLAFPINRFISAAIIAHNGTLSG